jgi:hypothetical protein
MSWSGFEFSTGKGQQGSGTLERPYTSQIGIAGRIVALFFVEVRQINPRWDHFRMGDLETTMCFPASTMQIRTPTGWRPQIKGPPPY